MINGRTIRKIRELMGMTQAEMAALIQMPLRTLTRLETDSLNQKALATGTKHRRRRPG
jgi:transcriptional regulator with XRE-family HTH domain